MRIEHFLSNKKCKFYQEIIKECSCFRFHPTGGDLLDGKIFNSIVVILLTEARVFGNGKVFSLSPSHVAK